MSITDETARRRATVEGWARHGLTIDETACEAAYVALARGNMVLVKFRTVMGLWLLQPGKEMRIRHTFGSDLLNEGGETRVELYTLGLRGQCRVTWDGTLWEWAEDADAIVNAMHGMLEEGVRRRREEGGT